MPVNASDIKLCCGPDLSLGITSSDYRYNSAGCLTLDYHLHLLRPIMPDFNIHDTISSFESAVSTSPTDGTHSAHYHTSSSHNSSAGIGKRRKNSKIKMSPVLKRASSTPQLNSLSVQESGALSPSALDKRRNKLGYQRISIACCK